MRRQGDREAHCGLGAKFHSRISGFSEAVAHVDAVVGVLADGVDPAQEPLTGVGLDLDLETDELVGQGGWVIVARAEAALGQLTGPASREAEESQVRRRFLAGL